MSHKVQNLKVEITEDVTVKSPSYREEEKEALRQFVENYEKCPELWNPSHPLYINKLARNSALDRLVPLMARMKPGVIRREDVKKKINSLRTNYRKELSKIVLSRISGMNGEYVYTPTSWVFYALSFLQKVEKPVSQQPMEPEVELEFATEEVIRGHKSSLDHTGETQLQDMPLISSSIPSRSYQTPFSRKKKFSIPVPVSKQNVLFQNGYQIMEPSSNTDNIPTIAKVWGEKLLLLQPRQRAFAENAINDVLFEASMGTLHRNSVKINEGENSPPRDGPAQS